MYRQQHILDDVVDHILRPTPAPSYGADERNDRFQKTAIGLGIAALRGGEKITPPVTSSVAAGCRHFILLNVL